MMNCPRCNAPIEEGSVFCGNCGNKITPQYATGATVAEPTQRVRTGDPISNFSGIGDNSFASMKGPQSPLPYPPVSGGQDQSFMEMPARKDPISYAPPPPVSVAPPPRPTRRTPSTVFIAIVLLLLIIGVSAGIYALVGPHPTPPKPTPIPVASGAVGTVFFSDSQNVEGKTDIAKFNLSGLSAPPAGSHYYAWLVDEATEKNFSLGQLQSQGQGQFTLNGSLKGQNILGLGNKLLITQEQGTPSAPTGKVILSGTFPPLAFIHIRHLLFSFPNTPNHIGLLVGLRQQAQLLNAEALLLKNANDTNQPQVVSCLAQSMIDIIEGTNGQNMKPLAPTCATSNVTQVGDGYGLLGNSGYIQTAANHASLAATQSDSTQTIKIHAHHVEICLDNVKGWVTSIDQKAQLLLTNPRQPHQIQDIVTLADHAYNGVDTNNDESIDPVPGEGGAITAYIHGQLMAQLRLNP